MFSFTMVADRILIWRGRHLMIGTFRASRAARAPHPNRSDPLIDSHHVIQKGS